MNRRCGLASRPAGLLLATLGAVVLPSCADLPERQPRRDPAPQVMAGQVTVHGRHGPVDAVREQRVLDAVKAEGRSRAAEHHLRVLAASGQVDLYRGNATRVLVDGPATFAAMKAALRRARGRILLESYIVEEGGIADELARILAHKVAQGVAVALLYDAVGSIRASSAYFEALAKAGVAVCTFNPINPLERPGRRDIRGIRDITRRDHRKVLVVDDEVAFTGGINISRVYSSGSFAAGRRERDEMLADGWRDTHVEVRGPAVQAFTRGFEVMWRSQGCRGRLGGPAAAAVAVAAPGQRVVKVLQSDPRDPDNRIYTALLSAIDASRRSVHVTMGYFAPGTEMVDALCQAARRGVEVMLVLPGRSDFALVLHAGRSYYKQLLEAGVRIFETENAIMHAKTAVIDGVFSTVGSSNLDWRSFVANHEINVIVLGADFGDELEALFRSDLARSREIDLRGWRRRGVGARLMETFGRLSERLL